MAKHVDSEGLEIKTVLRYTSFENKDILEIGCGDGRLTFKYAQVARRVIAIDPSEVSIETANRNTPKSLASTLTFRVGMGEDLSDYEAESFDVIFFTWSLCCTSVPVMGRALDEAWRVLKRDGILVNIQPSLHQPFMSGALTYLVKKKFGTSVDDERYRQSRLALKYKSLVEGMFDLVGEDEFAVKTVYDTVEDAIDDTKSGANAEYVGLDERTKRRIHNKLASGMTESGIVMIENAVLTILRKRGTSSGSV